MHRKNNGFVFLASCIKSGVAAFAFRKHPELHWFWLFLVSVETDTSIL